MDQLFLAFKTARIPQWIKNIVVFAPIVFSGFLFSEGALGQVIWAALLFCLASSGIYFFNDIVDIKEDREHPFKKKRPLASGKMPIELGIFWFLLLVIGSLVLAYVTSTFFFGTVLSYIALNIVYSLWWKKVAVLDVFSIAAGFVLRVYGGAFVINVHMDVWFLLTVVSASLFLAVGKRRSEMTLLTGAGIKAQKSRKTLVHYTPELLGAYTTMFANTTWLSYALFSFLHPTFEPEGKVLSLFALLPRTLVVDKWLMATVPLVILGVMRYMQLIYEKNEGESPHKVLMSDKSLLSIVGVWGVMVVTLLYFV